VMFAESGPTPDAVDALRPFPTATPRHQPDIGSNQTWI
jgi:hypothetical protein